MAEIDFPNDVRNTTRDLLRHENDLIKDRINWSTAAQGFLYGALGIGIDKAPSLQYLIPVIGIAISLMTIWGVLRAFEARHQLIESIPDPYGLPRLMGRKPEPRSRAWISPNLFLPALLGIGWPLVLLPGLWGAAGLVILLAIVGFRYIWPEFNTLRTVIENPPEQNNKKDVD